MIREGNDRGKGKLCRITSVISSAVKITTHQLLKWSHAMTEIKIAEQGISLTSSEKEEVLWLHLV